MYSYTVQGVHMKESEDCGDVPVFELATFRCA